MATDLAERLKSESFRDRMANFLQSPQRRQALIIAAGVLGGVLVLFGGYFAYDRLTSIPAPDVQTASPKEITGFMGSERGLARLPVRQRLEFVGKLYMAHEEPAKREDLASALRQMTSHEKKVCRDAMWDVGYSILTDEVDEYHRTPPEDREEFIDRKIAQYMHARSYIAGERMMGRGGAGGGFGGAGSISGRAPLLDESWLEGMPTNSEGVVKMVIAKTQPKARTRMRPYIENVRTRVEELRDDPREKERVLGRYPPEENEWFPTLK